LNGKKAIFNLINKTLISKSRLIITSSEDLQSLNFSLPDLESRLRKIESYELIPIQDKDILDALLYISNLKSINLGDKEAKYLVTYSQRNISSLVHILESLDQLSMEMKRKITIPLIKEVI
jgi:DnaA family protein